MYLHIGNGKSLKKKNVIGIFDLDTATVSGITKKFINNNQQRGRVEYDDLDLPRSFVLVSEDDGYRIRLSRISTAGLKQRAEGSSQDY
ncbi:MAG: DUF370 domain-containing protein [Clostridia bacterium]|nr:DUF370 domain-containing protein [Clostridia bacterium]